jgi:quercetin dioxygenase-like cupin family protein
MRPHLTHLALLALVLLATTSRGERDDRSQTHPFIVDLGPMGVDGEVVSGDPHKPGGIYVIHIRELPGMIVPPHFHPEDEHVTIVQGKWELAHGETFDRSKLRPLAVGAYSFMPRQMPHFAYSEDGAILQVFGVGPFKQTFLGGEKILSKSNDPQVFKLAIGDKVRHHRGDGVILDGWACGTIVQYEVQKEDGTLFMGVAEDFVRR